MHTSTNDLPCAWADALASNGIAPLNSNAAARNQKAQRDVGLRKFMATIIAEAQPRLADKWAVARLIHGSAKGNG